MSSAPSHAPRPRRPPDIAALLGVWERGSVRYVLIGSVAAHAHDVDSGQAGDLDSAPALDLENLQRLAAVLREIEAGLDPDAPFGHWDAGQDGEQRWVVDASTSTLRAARSTWQLDRAAVSRFERLCTSRDGNFDSVPEVSGAYDTLMQCIVPRWQGATPCGSLWLIQVDELLATLTIPRRQ